MICPVCSAEVDNNHAFCEYCGSKLESNVVSTPVEQSELVQPKKEKEMVFNIVFAIMMLWNGINSSIGAVGILISMLFNIASPLSVIVELISSVGTLAVSAFGIVTGIMLLKKKTS